MSCSLRRTERSLSLDENVRTEDGGKHKTGETALRLSSFPSHGPWRFVTSYTRFMLASVQKTKRLRRKRQHCSCEIQRAVHSPFIFNLLH